MKKIIGILLVINLFFLPITLFFAYNSLSILLHDKDYELTKVKITNLDDEVMGLLLNGIVQQISFNSGYIYHSNWKEWYKSHSIHKTEGWVFNLESKEEEEDFKETSAHEIGHELLQAYHGTIYSWQHKGSSYYFPQDRKPINESLSDKITHLDFMESNGENAPKSGEIDLMKYYNDYSDYKDRIVASEKDVKGLLWLTKLSLK